jgi:CubicO group peptidase (beta-lactamase class C family)
MQKVGLRHLVLPFFLASCLVPSLVQARSLPEANPKRIVVAQAQKTQSITEANVKAALSELEKLTNATLNKTGVPGLAIAVVYKDQIVYLKGFGVRETGKPDLVDPDTIFQLASVSKPIASTIVAGVVGKGLVKWDDPIIQHDPSFQLDSPYVTRNVTLRDLFAHRSGLPGSPGFPIHAGDDLEDLGFDRATILDRLRYLPTGDRFRSHYGYTNFGLTAAAIAAAKAAGKPWEVLATETLYRPLGMTHTSSRYADFLAAKNRALGHVPVDGKWVAKYQRDPDPESPAGGVSSSVRDLAQWVRLQLGNGKFEGKQIIDADALSETHRPQMVSNPPQNPATDRASFYGLGWGVGYTERGLVRLSHSGAFNLGTATAVYLLPSEDLGIVVLTNGRPIGVPEAIAVSFLDLVQYGKMQRDYIELYRQGFAELDKPSYGTLVDYAKPPTQRSPALPASAYAGTYENDYFGKMAIAVRDTQLVLLQGSKQKAFLLQHYNGNVFIYQPEGENAYGLSAVTFTIGADGNGTNVTIENLNLLDRGTFKRVLPKR